MNSSISLPNWQYSRLKALAGENKNSWLYKKYRMLLRYAARSHMRSHCLTTYNRKEYTYKKQTVTWDIEMYNRLRMAAHRLKISLSFLVHLVMLEEDEIPVQGSYHREDTFSRQFGLIFTEIIKYPPNYYPKPPD